MIERWCVCLSRPDGAPAVMDYAVSLDTTRPLRGTQFILCRAEFTEDEVSLSAAQADPRITVLPAKAVPINKIPAAMSTWLAANGISVVQGDTVLNVVRGLRNTLCDAVPGKVFSFPVSEKE